MCIRDRRDITPILDGLLADAEEALLLVLLVVSTDEQTLRAADSGRI